MRPNFGLDLFPRLHEVVADSAGLISRCSAISSVFHCKYQYSTAILMTPFGHPFDHFPTLFKRKRIERLISSVRPRRRIEHVICKSCDSRYRQCI